MRRTTFIVLGVVVVAGAIGIALTRRLASTQPGGLDGPAPGAAVPATSGKGLVLQFSDKPVALPALPTTDAAGHALETAAWKGKVVLVNFWATWCGPCREEIPTLVALQARYKDRLVVLGLSVDTRPPAEVQQFANAQHINYPVAIAGDDVVKAFGGIPAVPTTFVVSAAGKMLQRHVGILDPARTEQEVRVLAGLSSDAVVQTVPDTGQVFLANAAYATEIPGVSLKDLTPAQREQALTRMNTERCSCGCGLTVAQCRINDPSCDVSLPQAQKIAAEAAKD